jgi:hypothetical protein
MDSDKARADASEREYKEAALVLWEELDEAGLPSYTADLGEGYGRVRFVPNETIRSRVLNNEMFVEWATAEGREEELLRSEPRKRVLNEYVRECLHDKRDLPEGVDFTSTKFITITET